MFTIAIPVMLVLVVLLVLAKRRPAQARKSGSDGKYKRRDIMSDNEMEFFGRLITALPDHYIFPQVAMSALLDPAGADNKHSDRNRIAQKRTDYVVCNRRCEVIAVVELDDKTHSQVKDKLRDGRLEQGGYRTVRFQSRQKPSVDAIRAAILPPTAPVPVSVDNPVAIA